MSRRGDSLVAKVLRAPGHIVREGPASYVRRRLEAGVIRLHWTSLVHRRRLKASSVRVSGYELALPETREGIVRELLLFGVHEPVATRLYSNLVSPGDSVCDVGTNLGYYLAVAAGRIGPQGTIWGFEPDPVMYEYASRNAAGLGCEANLSQSAVSDTEGVAIFHRSEVPNWGSLVQSDVLRVASSSEVKTVSLDRFFADAGAVPSVLRMDIEGGELGALRGASTLLMEHHPKLYIEVHPFLMTAEDSAAVFRLLSDCGYDKALSVDRAVDWPWVPRHRLDEAAREETIDRLWRQAKAGSLPSVISVLCD